MIFYVKYNKKIYLYKNLCAALSFIKLVGGELFFKYPKILKQQDLFNVDGQEGIIWNI